MENSTPRTTHKVSPRVVAGFCRKGIHFEIIDPAWTARVICCSSHAITFAWPNKPQYKYELGAAIPDIVPLYVRPVVKRTRTAKLVARLFARH